jgi:two-component system sensor histidine kinase BaeS
VRLSVETRGAVPELHVDPERMAQVLANLLENALRHTDRGGLVQLSATRPDNDWVELKVVDSGEGIAPDHLPHVFERFYRADPARRRRPGSSASSGSGIGLTISRALVEAHGGGLSAHSAGEGHGATFTIRLPALGGGRPGKGDAEPEAVHG